MASDAHICFEIGKFDEVYKILEQEGYPYDLVVNRNLESFEQYLEERGRRIHTLKVKPKTIFKAENKGSNNILIYMIYFMDEEN